MSPEENARAALVSLCGYLVTSPVYGSTEAMWSRDLREVLRACGTVPRDLRAVFEAARNLLQADSARGRSNALARLRIELAARFEGEAVARVAALREARANTGGVA